MGPPLIGPTLQIHLLFVFVNVLIHPVPVRVRGEDGPREGATASAVSCRLDRGNSCWGQCGQQQQNHYRNFFHLNLQVEFEYCGPLPLSPSGTVPVRLRGHGELGSSVSVLCQRTQLALWSVIVTL